MTARRRAVNSLSQSLLQFGPPEASEGEGEGEGEPSSKPHRGRSGAAEANESRRVGPDFARVSFWEVPVRLAATEATVQEVAP